MTNSRSGKDLGEQAGTTEPLSPEAYRAIFEHASDGFFLHPPDSDEILAVNERLTEILGYSREELLDMRVSDLTADDWDPSVSSKERVEQARNEGHVTFEWRDQRKDGTAVWVEVNLTHLSFDGTERVLASVRDIEERKRQERRTRAVFEQTYQFTGLMEPDGTLIEANQTALEFGGLVEEDVIGQKVWKAPWFAYSDDIATQTKQAVARAADGEFVRMNLEVRGAEGTEVIDFSVRPVTDASGEVSLLIPEGRPITELVTTRERLAAHNRILRHNIRNRLTTINGSAEQIITTTDDSRVAEYAQRVLDAGSSLEQISEQLREFDQIREGERRAERIDLAALLGELQERYTEAAPETSLETEVADGLTVEADRKLLRVAVENIVENAIEHGGSSVQLAARTERRSRDGVAIVVRDDGAGIDAGEFEMLLGDEATPLNHPTSIGLVIVKWALDDLGGELDIASEDGTGTRVTLWIPDAV